jgi:hypothetical protein
MGFTPLDSNALFSTAFRTGALPWAVWTAILAATDADGFVAINPAFLAAQWRMPVEEVQEAWDVHTKPDPDSHNKDCDGARIIPTEDGRWLVVSHIGYRKRYAKEIRLKQKADAQRRYRERKQNGSEATTEDQA